MTNAVLLNNLDHRTLRVITAHGAAYGDDVMSAATFPQEFRQLQAQYPIVFHRSGERSFRPLVLLGLRLGENLFLHGARWNAPYIPLSIQRQPFLIGEQPDGPMVHVDLDSPRVSSTEGELLFREHGGTTEFLDHISQVLRTLHDGLVASTAFVERALRYDLLEPLVFEATLNNGLECRLAGLYVVHEERLRALDDAALLDLHRHGDLEPLYMAMASIAQFRHLLERMNRRHAG
ncbi:SapC family protein [Xanthomonas vasicola]|uniref:SapC family protein n=1 Tax=Xanthomonas vasicola TaxID=56459 RepID=UPI0001CC06F9|nr:SapC family protein [Xanthomonas vasicola]KFA30880.1 peptidase [Xanthomonas vasicola pv. musacearum NCPPB 4384]KFA07097.1 peptidase [Xanthomonas vasicola pv. musacearum NCPPB 4380]KFA12649.1 peptidase [Xanthomonas vasicola pv. musacearum NCPPB 2005]KFA16365.1 peptidase [Xanthomonas vasicola pv. musacearum NCPPB 4392]KFA21405.1 peptidase [Xanthomonas vasicola pv. musacearum NCPPB 4394]